MAGLTMRQILEMTDTDLVEHMQKNNGVIPCKHCGIALQESVTGHRTIKDEQGNEHEYCSDCYFTYEPFQTAVDTFLADPANRSPMTESELFARGLMNDVLAIGNMCPIIGKLSP